MFLASASRAKEGVTTHVLAVLAAMALLLLPVAAQAEDPARRVALVVGNTEYTSVERLPNAARDARAVADVLENVGFDVILVEEASGEAFEAAVAEAEEQAKGAAALLFYYSGHGFQLNGANYLVPVDAGMRERERIRQETMRLDEIVARFSDPKRQTLIFLDACRNNPLPASMRSEAGSDGLAELNAGPGTFVAFATEPGAVTADGLGTNSPFTNAFLSHVGTEGISVSDMMIRVRNDVYQSTVGRQTPWDQSSLRSQFYFVPADDEEGEISEEDVALLLELPLELRRKFADRLGVELTAEGEIVLPEEEEAPVLASLPSAQDEEFVPGLRFGAPVAAESEEEANDTANVLALLDDDTVPATGETGAPTLRESFEVAVLDTAAASEIPATAVAVAEPDRGSAVTGGQVALAVPNAQAGIVPVPVPAIDGEVVSPPSLPGQAVSGEADLLGSTAGAERLASLSTERFSTGIETRSAATSLGVTRSIAPPSDGRRVLAPVIAPAARIIGEDVSPAPERESGVRIASIAPAKEPVTSSAASAPAEKKADEPGLDTAIVDPDEALPSTAPADVPVDLPRALQGELSRLGCYRGAVDGLWGPQSQRAATRYALRRQIDPDSVAPDAALYTRLRAESSVVCRRVERAKPRRKVKVAARGPAKSSTRSRSKARAPARSRKATTRRSGSTKKRRAATPSRTRTKSRTKTRTRTNTRRATTRKAAPRRAKRAAPKRAARSTSSKPRLKKGGALRGVFR